MFNNEEVWNAVKGKKVVSITAGQEPDVNFEDGRRLHLRLDGDCCSSSYFTDLEQFNELIGATIQNIEERDGESVLAKTKTLTSVANVSWHFLVLETDKGHVTIDWRNDSNGYYDGSVCPTIY